MTQTDIAPDKIKAYETTIYRVRIGPKAMTLRIGRHSPELAQLYEQHGSACAVFITAFNPFGRKQGDHANEGAHARLGKQLRADSQHVVEGVGADPTEKWKEKSYLAFGIDVDAARELGRSFQQDAVVWIGKDAIPQLLLLR